MSSCTDELDYFSKQERVIIKMRQKWCLIQIKWFYHQSPYDQDKVSRVSTVGSSTTTSGQAKGIHLPDI